MLTINPVVETGPAKSLSSSPGRDNQAFQAMRPGKVLHVEVVRGGSNSALLRWGDHQFQAESQVALQEGQQLNVLVTENASRIKLKVLGCHSHSLQSSWPLLTEKNLLPRLLEAFFSRPELLADSLAEDTLNTLALFRSFQDNPDGLEQEKIEGLLRLLGMRFPGADSTQGSEEGTPALQSGLQELLAALKEPDSDFGKKLEAILAGLGRGASTDQDGKAGEAGFVFLPLPFLDKGFLVFQRAAAEDHVEEDSPWHLSLFLETGSLGELQIDFMEYDNGLLLKFVSGSQEVKQFLEAAGDDLKKSLTALPLRNLTFETASSPPVNALLKRIAGMGEGVLETWV
jgi:hypothetical protein